MAKKITQRTLANLLKLRARIAEDEATLAKMEQDLKDSLAAAGASVTAGMFKAELYTWERRSPAWKEVCERELGAEFCQRVLSHTKPTTHTKLVVEVNR